MPAAGRGERLGGHGPKALLPVGGVPLVVHAVRGLAAAGCVVHVVVAAPESHVDAMATLLTETDVDVSVLAGGVDRSDSVRRALRAAHADRPDTRIVLVHDAARAFTPPELIGAVAERVRAGAPAVVPVLPVADTIKRVDRDGTVTETPARTDLRAVQTPQGFDRDVLWRAYLSDEQATRIGGATDDAGLVERLGVPVTTITGHPAAMKITTPFDMAVAEALLARTEQAR